MRAALASDDISNKLTPEEIETRLPREHPSNYYLYALRLMKAGRDSAALRWFYIGQLRYRIYVQAHPAEDSNLFASLTQSVGEPLNRYGALHRDEWLAAIDAALAWDDAHENETAPKDKFAAIYAAQRAGLLRLKDVVTSRGAEIQAAASGRESMPKNWPTLAPVVTARDLEGVFGPWDVGSVTSIFFPPQPAGFNWFLARELELKALSETRLLAIARGKTGELARNEFEVTLKNGAASFSLPDTIGQDPRGGGSRGTAYLHRNTAQDLVVERDVTIEEIHEPGAVAGSIQPHRFWKRASVKSAQVNGSPPVPP